MRTDPHPIPPGDRSRVRLVCHADSGGAGVRSLEARAQALRPGVIGVEFTLTGARRAVRIPPPGPAARADELWRHTCFEAFVRRDDVPGYLEFNFSPSGAWQAYHFIGYRQDRLPALLPAPPAVTVRHRERAGSAAGTDEALILEALVHLPAPFGAAPQGLRLALSAVVEQETGSLSYWALRHGPGRPDFHHPDAFALTLQAS
jgi:hypothetical protein